MAVVVGENARALRQGEIKKDQAAFAQAFPERCGKLKSTDAIGFCFREDGAIRIIVLKCGPEKAVKATLGGLGAIGSVAQDGSSVIGETF